MNPNARFDWLYPPNHQAYPPRTVNEKKRIGNWVSLRKTIITELIT
jgi:hypothetical protein